VIDHEMKHYQVVVFNEKFDVAKAENASKTFVKEFNSYS